MKRANDNQGKEKAPRLKALKSKLLEELFIRVNWLKFNEELGYIEELPSLSFRSIDAYTGNITDNRYSTFKNPIDKWTEKARWDLYKATENLPKELQNHIWGTDLSNITVSITKSDPDLNMREVWQQTKDALERYENYELLRNQFFWISTVADVLVSKDSTFKTYSIPISTLSKFEVYENGKSKIILDDFSQLIQEGKVDIRYVRKCKHFKCQRFFWAGKTNKKCCSSKCNNRVNALDSIKKAKKQREANPIEFNEKRKADTERREKNKILKSSKLKM